LIMQVWSVQAAIEELAEARLGVLD